MATRVHFSDTPCVPLEPRVYKQDNGLKPNGLWYSVEGNGDGWSDWCETERFRDTASQIAYEIRVDYTRMAVIHSVDELRAFERQWAASWANLSPILSNAYINWPGVAAEYSGVEIPRHLWSARFESLWYSGWDCACGVVWDIIAILSFEETR